MQARREGQPEKPARKLACRIPGVPRINVELPMRLLEQIQRLARANRRSRTAEVVTLLEEAVAAREKS